VSTWKYALAVNGLTCQAAHTDEANLVILQRPPSLQRNDTTSVFRQSHQQSRCRYETPSRTFASSIHDELTPCSPKSPSAPSRSLRKRRSRIAPSPSGSVCAQTTPSGTAASLTSPEYTRTKIWRCWTELMNYRYNAKRRHWRKTRIGI
jgi:hypothetical protein